MATVKNAIEVLVEAFSEEWTSSTGKKGTTEYLTAEWSKAVGSQLLMVDMVATGKDKAPGARISTGRLKDGERLTMKVLTVQGKEEVQALADYLNQALASWKQLEKVAGYKPIEEAPVTTTKTSGRPVAGASKPAPKATTRKAVDDDDEVIESRATRKVAGKRK